MNRYPLRSSKLNTLAMIGACVGCMSLGVTGHYGLSALLAVIGAALCMVIIYKEPIP